MNEAIKVVVVAGLTIVLRPAGEYLLALVQFNFTGAKLRNIAGNWKSCWSFSDPDKSETSSDIIELRQTGPFVRGIARGDKYHYVLKGRLNPDGFIQGTWRDVQRSTDWYGSFKLLVGTDGKKMAGKWIGKSRTLVRAGDWTWERC